MSFQHGQKYPTCATKGKKYLLHKAVNFIVCLTHCRKKATRPKTWQQGYAMHTIQTGNQPEIDFHLLESFYIYIYLSAPRLVLAQLLLVKWKFENRCYIHLIWSCFKYFETAALIQPNPKADHQQPKFKHSPRFNLMIYSKGVQREIYHLNIFQRSILHE